MGKPYDRSDLNDGGGQRQSGAAQEQAQGQTQEQAQEQLPERAAPSPCPQRHGGSDVERPHGDGNSVNQANGGTAQRDADGPGHPPPMQQKPGYSRR